MMEKEFSTLPELAKPSLYNICLKPCLKTFKFQGVSTILFDVILIFQFFYLVI